MTRMAAVEGVASRRKFPEVVEAVAAVEAEPTNDLARRSPD